MDSKIAYLLNDKRQQKILLSFSFNYLVIQILAWGGTINGKNKSNQNLW